jgi:hypothetical protein
MQIEKMKVIRDYQKSEGDDIKRLDEGIAQLEQALNQLKQTKK